MKKFFLFLTLFSLAVSGAAEMPNLLKNGSFEEGLDAKGAPKHWIIDRNDKVDGVVKLVSEHKTHGKYAVFLDKRNTRGSLYLRQVLRLKPNTDYVLELKGYRESGHRWHSVAIRQPGTKNIVHGKIPVGGGAVAPIKVRTDVKKTLTYVYFGLWSYTKENNQGTIGKMWVDEVSFRELPRISGAFKGVALYYFSADGIKGRLFSNSHKGNVTLAVTAAKGKKVTKTIEVVPGENPFTIDWQHFPAGEALLTAAGGDIKLEQKIMIQKNRE